MWLISVSGCGACPVGCAQEDIAVARVAGGTQLLPVGILVGSAGALHALHCCTLQLPFCFVQNPHGNSLALRFSLWLLHPHLPPQKLTDLSGSFKTMKSGGWEAGNDDTDGWTDGQGDPHKQKCSSCKGYFREWGFSPLQGPQPSSLHFPLPTLSRSQFL